MPVLRSVVNDESGSPTRVGQRLDEISHQILDRFSRHKRAFYQDDLYDHDKVYVNGEAICLEARVDFTLLTDGQSARTISIQTLSHHSGIVWVRSSVDRHAEQWNIKRADMFKYMERWAAECNQELARVFGSLGDSAHLKISNPVFSERIAVHRDVLQPGALFGEHILDEVMGVEEYKAKYAVQTDWLDDFEASITFR